VDNVLNGDTHIATVGPSDLPFSDMNISWRTCVPYVDNMWIN